MSKNGPLMYRVKPLYDSNPNIILPTCMYKLNSIYDTVAPTSVSNMNSENVDQDDMKLIEIEKRQLGIIQKLEDLKKSVVKMTEVLDVAKPEIEKPRTRYPFTLLDIVIKANPQCPPLSVWVFHQVLSRFIPIRLVTHLHSSLKSTPETVSRMPNFYSQEESHISLTVIWRDGSQDHEMVVSPIHQGLIEGEVNIVRYLWRTIAGDSNSVVATLIDDWLEMGNSSVLHGNNKERQAVLRSLNSHLGKKSFLVGDSVTVADIFMWSALIQAKLHENLPTNALKWFKSLLNHEYFVKYNEFVSL